MSLTKNDLHQIKSIVLGVIDEKIPAMIEEGTSKAIDAKVPSMIEKAIDEKVPAMIEEGISKAIDEKVPSMIEDGASKVFAQGFEMYVIPYVDSKFYEIRAEMNDHVLSLHTRIDENAAHIGHYFEECATKDQVAKLENRVQRCERLLKV